MIRTFDIDKINSILKHPDIWPLISDNEDINDFSPPLEGFHYLYAQEGLFILHEVGDDTQIHANVLLKGRDKAKEMAQEALKYGFEEMKANRIVAKIPTKFGNVYGFAKKFMQDQGIINEEHFLTLRAEQWSPTQDQLIAVGG